MVEVTTVAVQYGAAINNFRFKEIGSFSRIYRYLEENDEKRLHKLDRKLANLAKEVDGWLINREIKVLGCDPPDDCHTIDRVCGHAGINGCKLKRK